MNFIGNLLIDSIYYGSLFFFFSVIFSYVNALGDFSKVKRQQGGVKEQPTVFHATTSDVLHEQTTQEATMGYFDQLQAHVSFHRINYRRRENGTP